jgi:cell division protein FtsL
MKTIKITNNWEGKNYMKYQRDIKTGQFKNKVKSFFKKVLFWVVVVLILMGVGAYARWAYPVTEINIRETKVEIDNLGPKIEELKNEVLDLLVGCESKNSGYTDNDGLITFDPSESGNKKVEIPSIGLYQFKKATVIAYVARLDNKKISGKEAVLLAIDETSARELASRIIFETQGGIYNWLNCSKTNDIVKKVEFIKKLSK